MMRRENVETSGHLQLNKNTLLMLNDLHHALLKDPKFDVYASEFYKTLPYIVELRSRQGESKLDEIETCFAALYGTLMLKLQGKGISVDTQKAIAQITKFISLLSKYHKLDQEDKLWDNQ